MALHAPGEFLDDGGVADVFFLRGLRHEQVFAHEPYEQVAVVGGKLVGLGELGGILCAELGMVAAASFGDVVEQGGKVEDGLLGVVLHEGGEGGVFVAVFFLGEAA